MGLIGGVLFGSSFVYWLGFEGGKLRMKRKLNLNLVFVGCIVYVLALPPHEAFLVYRFGVWTMTEKDFYMDND